LAAVLSRGGGGPQGPPVVSPPAGRRRDERGMTTAEYAVGTVGAACMGGILIIVCQDDWWLNLVQAILDRITGWLSIGEQPMFRVR